MFDINALKTGNTAKYHVKDAKGRLQYDGDKPVTITAHGPGTKKAAQAKFNYDTARSERTLKGIGGTAEERTEAQERRERAEYLAQLVASLDFDYSAGAAALFADPDLRYLADDFEKWWNNAGNFSAGSESSASNTQVMQPG